MLFPVEESFLEVYCTLALIFADPEVSNLMGRFGIVGCLKKFMSFIGQQR